MEQLHKRFTNEQVKELLQRYFDTYNRFQRYLQENISLFRQLVIPKSFLSTKDIFCLCMKRIADAYRKISINNFKLKANNLDLYET